MFARNFDLNGVCLKGFCSVVKNQHARIILSSHP
jgi:hypothetical protein